GTCLGRQRVAGQVEQRLEPAKRAAHNVHKRLQACLQGQSGADMDKRVKKLPLMALSTTMAESFKELDPDSSMGKALEMSCAIQNQLARILAEFEMTLERDVLQPLNRLSEVTPPPILKHKKSLQKLVSDWNTLKSRLSQAAKNSGSGQGLGGGPGSHTATANKVETLKEEEEELKRKVEQCKDEYLADLYHFATKEDTYANYFIHLMEIQADYHRKSLSSLDTALAELRENHSQTDPSPSMTAAPFSRVYGVPLGIHLRELGRDIALPIEACVMMLLSEGMKEEGLFRLAAGASVLKRLKQTMASDPRSLQEFCSDPHAVAGSALKSYLRELPEPLMTFDLYDDWMRAASLKEPGARLEALQEVCSRLPHENLSNLRYLMKFLAQLAEEQEVNKMTPSNIAIVLGPNLLWPPEKDGDLAQLDAASVSSIQVVGVVEALIQNTDTLFPGDINFNVSGLFSAPAPQDKVSNTPASEELPSIPTPTPATVPALGLAPAPASVATKESHGFLLCFSSALWLLVVETSHKDHMEAGTSPVVQVRGTPQTNLPQGQSEPPGGSRPSRGDGSEDSCGGIKLGGLPQAVQTPNHPFPSSTAKRPAPARPTMPPPQVSGTRSSPPAPLPPPGSGSPVTPRALPRRLVGSSLRAPTPPLPPTAPQPARRQSRHSPASPSPASPGPPLPQSSPLRPGPGASPQRPTEPTAPPRHPSAPLPSRLVLPGHSPHLSQGGGSLQPLPKVPWCPLGRPPRQE
ncbi:SH3 domain-binding protein 1, partial [Bos mutus]